MLKNIRQSLTCYIISGTAAMNKHSRAYTLLEMAQAKPRGDLATLLQHVEKNKQELGEVQHNVENEMQPLGLETIASEAPEVETVDL